MRVVKAHQSSFDKTPRVAIGGRVAFTELDPKNPAWFKGRDLSGVEGFFPEAWFDIDRCGGSAVAKRNYFAHELTAEAGDELEILEHYGEWYLARCGADVGWIAQSCCSVGD